MFLQVLQNSFDLKLVNNKQEKGVEQELGPSDRNMSQTQAFLLMGMLFHICLKQLNWGCC